MIKRCSKCKEWKDLSGFGNNKQSPDGLNYWCKGCSNMAKRETDKLYHRKARAEGRVNKTEEYREYRMNKLEAVRAQQLLNKEIKKGRIQKSPCEVCGTENTHAHHPDYSKPFDVLWLCPLHHKAIHPGVSK